MKFKYLLIVLCGLYFNTQANADITSVVDCTNGSKATVSIAIEYIATSCPVSSTYDYVGREMDCINGKLTYTGSSGGASYFYGVSPAWMENYGQNVANAYQGKLFRNTDGTQFIMANTKWFNGTIDNIQVSNDSLYPSGSIHYDVFDKTIFPPPSTPDADQDGYTICNDCADNNSAINPSASEVCNDSADNNCDGLTDCEDEPTCGACAGGEDIDSANFTRDPCLEN